MRGGSRPGLIRQFTTQLGSGNPVRMLSDVVYLDPSRKKFWLDSFAPQPSSLWSTAVWLSNSPSVYPEFESDLGTISEGGAVRTVLSDMDTTGTVEYIIDMCIRPYHDAFHGKYRIYARMASGSPNAHQDGIECELVMTGGTGAYTGVLNSYVAGVKTAYAFTGGTPGSPMPGVFRVKISGDTITCYWRGVELVSQAVSAHTGYRFGYGMQCTVSGGITLCDYFKISYTATSSEKIRRTKLVASSNGVLYIEDTSTTLAAVTETPQLTLASDRQLMAADYLQKLYIADVGAEKAAATDGVISGATLDSATYADWTALGINVYDDVVELYAGTGPTLGIYEIAADGISTNKLTLKTSPGNGTAISFRILRGAKVYDPSTNKLALWLANVGSTPAAGKNPTGCDCMAVFRGRLVLANGIHWYMSRVNDPLDFNLSGDASDPSRAIAGSDSEAGEIGHIITALIPHTDDYMVMGCTDSLWVMKGDPAWNGMIQNLSRDVGIVSKTAWCNGPHGELIFLSSGGLYMLQPGGASYPVSISGDKIPLELKDIDPKEYEISLEFDVEFGGVHIFMTPNASRTMNHFWFDWSTKSFWIETYQADHEPTAACFHRSYYQGDSGVILGGRDGYLRRFFKSAEDDDGSDISSYVYYGPIRLGDGLYDGLIGEMDARLASESGNVVWTVKAGETAEEALSSSSYDSGTFVAGKNYTIRPRMRGMYFTLKLAGQAGNRSWEVEEIQGIRKSGGRVRTP